MVPHCSVQDIVHIFASFCCCVQNFTQMIFMQASIDLQEHDLIGLRQSRHYDFRSCWRLLQVIDIHNGCVRYETGWTGTDVIFHGNARINQRQGRGIHTGTVVPSIWLQHLQGHETKKAWVLDIQCFVQRSVNLSNEPVWNSAKSSFCFALLLCFWGVFFLFFIFFSPGTPFRPDSVVFLESSLERNNNCKKQFVGLSTLWNQKRQDKPPQICRSVISGTTGSLWQHQRFVWGASSFRWTSCRLLVVFSAHSCWTSPCCIGSWSVLCHEEPYSCCLEPIFQKKLGLDLGGTNETNWRLATKAKYFAASVQNGRGTTLMALALWWEGWW